MLTIIDDGGSCSIRGVDFSTHTSETSIIIAGYPGDDALSVAQVVNLVSRDAAIRPLLLSKRAGGRCLFICRKCGADVHSDYFCRHCGQRLKES